MIDPIKQFFIFSLEFKVYWLAPIVAVDQKVCINVSLHEFSSDVSIVFFPSLNWFRKVATYLQSFSKSVKATGSFFLASFAKLLYFFSLYLWILFNNMNSNEVLDCVLLLFDYSCGFTLYKFYFKRVFFCFILNFDLIPIFIRKIYALTFNYIQTQGGLEHWETSVQLSMSQQHWKRSPWSPHHQKTRSTTTSGGLVSSVWPTYDLSIYNHFSIRCALRLKQTAFSPRQLDRIYMICVWYI